MRQETIDALGDDLRASIEEKVTEITASTEDRDMIGVVIPENTEILSFGRIPLTISI